MKKLFQKPIFKNIISPILRGALKQVPIVGTPIAEILTNVGQMASQEKDAPKVELKHKWMSIAVQAGCAILVLYGLQTQQISIDQILGWLGMNFSAAAPVAP